MKNHFESKKIGVWGFGRVGKSVVTHLFSTGCQLTVLDTRTLSPEEKQFLANKNISLVTLQELPQFLADNDFVVPSPGIDLRPHTAYKHKWLSELDLFARSWHKPYIAITGTVGKTTVTHLLGQLLQKSGKRVTVGGNIGIAMLDLLSQHDSVDLAVLEVSSFQLELTMHFAPDLALWTNFHENHLDRHNTLQEYFDAKAAIMRHQHRGQHALVPLELAGKLFPGEVVEKYRSHPGLTNRHFFSITPPTPEQLAAIPDEATLFFIRDEQIFMSTPHRDATQSTLHKEHSIAQLTPELLEITFAQNWLAICAMLALQNISCTELTAWAPSLNVPAHRLEKVATIAGVDFYNDSKATTPQSTLAAVNKLSQRPVILFLGGLSKGIDRTNLVKLLPPQVKMVYCFGKEAPMLSALCATYGIPCKTYATLDDSFYAAAKGARAGDQLLFSPAGSSFDLFANYEARGICFKQLVQNYQKNAK